MSLSSAPVYFVDGGIPIGLVVLVSYHTTLRVLKGRHEYDKKENSWCSNKEERNNDIISQQFCNIRHQNPKAPKKNTLPLVA